MSSPQNQSKDRGSAGASGASIKPIPATIRSTAQSTGPSCPPSRLAEISHRPYSAVSAPTAPESQVQEAAHARPNSAFPSSSFAPPDVLTPPMYFPRPDSASVSSPESTSFPPRDRLITTVEQHDAHASRPDTALLYDRPDTAELPPRRALPFRRDSLPGSSGNDSNRPQSRPSTALMGPPPLPTRVSDLRPGSARTSSLDSELPPLRQPTIVSEATRASPMQQRPLTPISPAKVGSKPAQTTAIYEEQQGLSPTSSSPHAHPTSVTRPLSAVSSATRNRRQSASPGVFPSPPASGSKNRIDRTLDPALAGNNENALKAYAMQSDDGRRAALNDFILKSLDNNDFLTLVEDMETNWARLGLGTW